jgi:hypothetical protein
MSIHTAVLLFALGARAWAQAPNVSVAWLDEPGRQVQQGSSTTLRVRVTDAAGAPVAGTPVIFRAPLNGPSGVFVPDDGSPNTPALQVQTDADGIVSATLLAGTQLGPYLAEAGVEGGRSVTFGITNVAGRVTAPALAASAARQTIEAKIPRSSVVHGPVWLPPFTTVQAGGPPTLDGAAIAISTSASAVWLFWIDLRPDQFLGHSVQYVLVDATRNDASLPTARYLRESWWPTVRLPGATETQHLLPPSWTSPPVSTPPPASGAGGSSACAIVLHGPGAQGAAANAVRALGFYVGQGMAVLTMEPEEGESVWGAIGPPATRAGLTRLVQASLDRGCTTLYLHLTAVGYPTPLFRASASGTGFGGVLLAVNGVPADEFDYSELQASLTPLRGTRLQIIVEAANAGNAPAALFGEGMNGEILAGADKVSSQPASGSGTPLSRELYQRWQAALDGGRSVTFAEVAAEAAAASQSSAAVSVIRSGGNKTVPMPTFAFLVGSKVARITFNLPADFPAGSPVTVQVSGADSRVAEFDPRRGTFTAGREIAEITVYPAGLGVTPYLVQLSGVPGTPVYEGVGSVSVSQDLSCTPERVVVPVGESVDVNIATGAQYDPLFHGATLVPRSLDDKLATVSSQPVSLGETTSLRIQGVARGSTSIQLTGLRAFGPPYTACLIDVTVNSKTGPGTTDLGMFISQTDSSLRRVTRVMRSAGGVIADLALPRVASPSPSGSEPVCSIGTAPAYAGMAASPLSLQTGVRGNSNPHLMCWWAPVTGVPASLQTSAFVGGSRADTGSAIAPDADGNLIFAGSTDSRDYPITTNGRRPATGREIFITRMSRLGDRVLFSTYFGGSGDDFATALALDGAGNIYITGYTASLDFPITANAFQRRSAGGTDAFVAKFDGTTGALVFSTLLGGVGTDLATSLAVDRLGAVYIAGQTSSIDFPATPGALRTTRPTGDICLASEPVACPDAFVAKFSPDGSALQYATYLGGSRLDNAQSIAVDAGGNAIVAGATASPDFPMLGTAAQKTPAGALEGYVVMLNPAGTALVAATFLGGTGNDEIRRIALGPDGSIVAAGNSGSSDFPVTQGAFQRQFAGDTDVFLTVFSPGLRAIIASTYFGGSGQEIPSGLVLGTNGRIYFAGNSTLLTRVPAP